MKHLVEIGKERKGMNLYMCNNCNAVHGYVGVEVEYPNNLCYVCNKYTTHKLVFLSGQQLG